MPTMTRGDLNRLELQPAIPAGSAFTVKMDECHGRQINLDTATGSTVTLPPATGSGAVFSFVVSALATSNSHIVKVANSSDAMQGGIVIADTDSSGAASSFFAVAGTSDTITLNRSTTGSVVVGEYLVVRDVAANRYQVEGLLAGTGAVATPFSATV